ncbi:MAG: HAD-IA family hydrolase [gamma proteobacterium symbiont of Bathyaustriella thionipta]|nr:HAD-IA family hydrolase [gamma proteobacterium symbiont of Bathyaustriella thionipta]MCU7949628.1 HAD-IA family hydrolase [gamma proteobacterium symbiont of Bathyaustriella thionipta]MCU7952194.1 HAD-IA family hydrolase [gamma proteobacterium symbiont of Bathyaustriella thionipta]MCU7956207.1 HAD-IA family hydrolase [gamma proteobacterium symbiont of Bathyaustriella thionipta]MCU7966799.1 HAD-IA family hydrolase [gamma proteobacterium symbiont of Bathyaustriella thionipta]
MPAYKLIIFDWDGTLMDSQARIVACLQCAAEELKLHPLNEDNLKKVIGLGLNEAVSSLYPELKDKQVNHFADRYRYHFITANDTPTGLFDDVREMLKQLTENGFMLAIATGKARRGLEPVLVDTGLKNMFHGSRCADETRSKPHPQMLEELLYEFGVTADEAIMVGDTEYDMLMAKSLGMDALAVSYGVHDKADILKHEPLSCVDSVGELSKWLLNGE